MARQIPLPIDELRPGGSDSLIITSSNSMAFAALGNSAQWPGHCTILFGPPRSGKTLMARYFLGQGGAVVDCAEQQSDEALFHRWNAAKETGQALLLLSHLALAEWDIRLPDLRSRLGAAQLIEIAPPDDDLITQLILKHLNDRGTSVTPEVLRYIVKRIERSHAAIEEFAKTANNTALADGGAINLALVKQIFAAVTD